jgi:UDP-N-acetylglucosamine:LPS N-acetylglucosamine transferase
MRKTILAISSGGGHWVQLLRLKKAWQGFPVIYASVNMDSMDDVKGHKFYKIPDANRWSKIRLVYTALRILFLIIKIRPKIIISTGAAPGYFAVFWGKRFGSKTIWLDSIANASELSMSGKLVGRYADVWLTQWEQISKSCGPEYHGSVL